MTSNAAPLPLPQAAPTQYRVRAGETAADGRAAATVWRECEFGGATLERDLDRYEWFYLRNPQGTGVLSFLEHPSSPVPIGCLGAGQRRWTVDGRSVSAAVLVDFVVHPQHRSAAPALLLQRQTRDRIAVFAPIAYGLPDTKAVIIFKRLGAAFQCALPRYARVLRLNAYLGRLLPRWLAAPIGSFGDLLDLWATRMRLVGCRLTGEWLDQFDTRFDSLWSRYQKAGRSIGTRDSAFLHWRFAQQPGQTYRTFAIRSANGALAMYFVCRMDGTTLLIKDYLAVADDREIQQGLLLLNLAARRIGATAVSIQVFGDESLLRALKRTHYSKRDERPFFATVTNELAPDVTASRWYITQADEDI